MGDEILQQKKFNVNNVHFKYRNRLQNSPYFCVFKYARAVNEAENREKPRLHRCGHIFWMDKNVHGSAFRLHDTRGAVQVFDLIRINDSCKQNCNL